MTLSRESKQIEGILTDLESDSPGRKRAAFESTGPCFSELRPHGISG